MAEFQTYSNLAMAMLNYCSNLSDFSCLYRSFGGGWQAGVAAGRRG